MRNTVKTILVTVGTTLVVIAIAGLAFWYFSPMRDLTAADWRPGMWHLFQARDTDLERFGPMGRGMMGEMHAMADVRSEYEFLVNMIPHHEEAVETATILRDRTDREEMRVFANSIIEVQTREIEQMEAWLARWYPERPTRAEYEPMMGDYRRQSGDDLDAAFLRDMIPHHMAAVMMSQQVIAAGLAEHEEVKELAATIRDAQMREIHQMRLWLGEWNL